MTRNRRRSTEPGHRRKFLVVVDATPECDRAIYFASRRAQSTGGGLVMLSVIEPHDPQSWRGVEELMREEAHQAAEEALDKASAHARAVSGIEPERRIEEGEKAEAVLRVIESDEDLAILVLAAGIGREGPGPLVSALASGVVSTFPIPITIVPGDLTDEEIDAIA